MIRLHEPTSGQVVLDGVDISGLGNRALREHRAKMQIIFQIRLRVSTRAGRSDAPLRNRSSSTRLPRA